MATTTVNISLPTNLKKEADSYVARGDFASFSDFVRTTMRDALRDMRFKSIIEESKREEDLGTATILNGPEEIDKFMSNIGKWK